MCLIIDACVANRFTELPHENAEPIVKWALSVKPSANRHIVYGGKLKRELLRAGEGIRRFLRNVEQSGRLIEVSEALLNPEQIIVEELYDRHEIDGADDPHILALARISGSRLLFTEDNRSKLIDLFRDKRFVDPPGKVYKSKANADLLKNPRKCKPIHAPKKRAG